MFVFFSRDVTLAEPSDSQENRCIKCISATLEWSEVWEGCIRASFIRIVAWIDFSACFIYKTRILLYTAFNSSIFFVYSSMAGVSRSTSLVAAYIMAVTQLNWRDAIKAIKCSRSIANPNYGFQRQLQDFYNLQASKVHTGTCISGH